MWTTFPECLVTPHMVLLPLTWPSISQTRGCTCLKWCFSIDHCCKWYLVPLGYWWILHNGCHNSQNLYRDMYLTCKLQSYICAFHRQKIVTRYMCIFSTWKKLSTLKYAISKLISPQNSFWTDLRLVCTTIMQYTGICTFSNPKYTRVKCMPTEMYGNSCHCSTFACWNIRYATACHESETAN